MPETLRDLHTKKESENESRSHTKRIISAIILGIFLFLIIGTGSAYGYFKYYQTQVYPGINIAGYDIGGLDKKQAEKLISDKVSSLKSVGLVLSTKEDTAQYELRLEDLGIGFDKAATLEKAYSVGRASASDFYNALGVLGLLIEGKNISLVTTFDDEKMQSKINSMLGDQLVKKENAYFNIKNGEISIVNEVKGSEVNFVKLKQAIHDVLNSGNISQKIVVKTEETIPEITASDIEVNRNQLQNYIDKKIVLTDESHTFTPTKEDIARWIVLSKTDGKLKIDFSDDEIRKYVSSLASSVDINANDKKIDGNTGAVISEGNDGKIMNQEKAYLEIKSTMLGNSSSASIAIETQTITRKEVRTQAFAGNGTPGLAPGKYVEVNLSNQVLYAYDGNNMIGSYLVSTGAWDHPTPVGTLSIIDKSLRPFSAQYGLYMPWWNGLGGGYGIHELPEWPGGYKEGESHLGTPVSHGCIRLGVGPAEFIYNWAPIGTQVFIHY